MGLTGLSGLSGLALTGAADAYLLLRDTFTTALDPVVDGAAVPGAGTRDATGALWKALGSALRGGSQVSSPAWGSSKIVYDGFSRTPGRTFAALVTLEDYASDIAVGWATATNVADPRTDGHAWVAENGALKAASPGATATIDGAVVNGTTRAIRSMQYLAMVVLNDRGALVYLSSFGPDNVTAPAGGFLDQVGIPAYPSARLVWEDAVEASSTLYPIVSAYDSGNGATTYPNGQCIQDVRVVDVAAWNTADALASLAERFTRADSASSLGGSWTAVAGTWGISSNAAYLASASGFAIATLANALPSGGDGVYCITITTPNPTTVGFGVLLRVQDNTNFLRLWNNGGNTLTLQTWVAGGFGATVANAAYTWPTAGTQVRIFVAMIGNQYRAWIKNLSTNAISEPWGGWQTDSNNRFLTARGVGLYGNNTSGYTTTRWDGLATYAHTVTVPAEIAAGAVPVVYTPGATIASDTFTDANTTRLNAHTAESGGAWTEHQGTWTISSNRATVSAASGSNFATQDLSRLNAECSVDIITPSSFATGKIRAGIVVRYASTTSLLFVRLFKDGSQANNDEIELQEGNGSSAPIVHKTNIGAYFATSTTYTLKVQIAADPNGGADLLHVFLDGKARISYKLAYTAAGTRFGLYREDIDDGCVFDAWQVKAVA